MDQLKRPEKKEALKQKEIEESETSGGIQGHYLIVGCCKLMAHKRGGKRGKNADFSGCCSTLSCADGMRHVGTAAGSITQTMTEPTVYKNNLRHGR